MMLSRTSTRVTTSFLARRRLVTSAQKRALNKQQLEGSNASSPPPASAAPSASASGGGSSTKPADVSKSGGGGGGSSGGGGGGILGILALGAIGAGGAYYMDMIPGTLKNAAKKSESGGAEKKAAPELKEVVEEVTHPEEAEGAATEEVATEVTTEEAPPAVEETPEEPMTEGTEDDLPTEETEEEESLEHPEDGNRVDTDKISSFYKTVSESRAKQQLEEAEEAAEKATQYNESYETVPADPAAALSSATAAMNELQTTTSLESSHTLAAARAALRSDLDQEYFKDLDTLNASQLRVRVVQLATEMADRTKWEAVRLKEFLAMKEKEVGEKYLEILQKQRLEFESLLAQKLREQEDTITRQANAALQAKEESIQSLLQATSAAREKETEEILSSETKRITSEVQFEYQQQLQNEMAAMKEKYMKELEEHANVMKGLQEKLGVLESRLEVSRNYESGSKRAHKISAAALALANKLEVGETAAVEIAALKGAAGDEGVIASAVKMIPKSADAGVPTVTNLQAAFDKTYAIGRQAAMVPEGRSGLEGQLLGMIFAKLSVPPSPDSVPTSEEEGNVADGILSLARKYVQLGDLEKAVDQLNKLKGQAAYVVQDWKVQASDRISTERALKVIKLECALLNKDLVNSGS